MVEEGPEGFCTEAALCFLYIGLYLYMVLTAVALSMLGKPQPMPDCVQASVE